MAESSGAGTPQPLMHRHPRCVSQRVFRIFNLLSQTFLDTLLKKLIVGGADSVISASPAHSSHTLQYLVGTMCLLTIAPRSRHVHRMHREQATRFALMACA